MEEKNIPKRGFWHELYKVSLWTLILLGGTVIISVAYKGMIESGILQVLVRGKALFRFVFCVFEFLLIVAYWYGVYRFSVKCRHRSRSAKVYYIRITIVFVIFAMIYWASFIVFGREVFMWIFRMTINLICFRFVTTAPENLIPYMTAYLVMTFLIMIFEPRLTKIRRKIKKKFSRGIRGMAGVKGNKVIRRDGENSNKRKRRKKLKRYKRQNAREGRHPHRTNHES